MSTHDVPDLLSALHVRLLLSSKPAEATSLPGAHISKAATKEKVEEMVWVLFHGICIVFLGYPLVGLGFVITSCIFTHLAFFVHSEVHPELEKSAI